MPATSTAPHGSLTDFDLSQRKDYRPSATDTNEETEGIEIETHVPAELQIAIGGYHNGIELHSDRPYVATDGSEVYAPTYNGKAFRAERDMSIRFRGNRKGCEFVSPVFQGEAGRLFVLHFLAFLKAIGAKVNASCGMHHHVGFESIVGRNAKPTDCTLFLSKTTKYGLNLQFGFYAQTGSRRDTNNYSHAISASASIVNLTKQKAVKAKRDMDDSDVRDFQYSSQRGSFLNLTHVTSNSKPTMEFRWQASTLNPNKVLAHMFSNLWLVKFAWEKRNAKESNVKYCGYPPTHNADLAVQGQKTLRDLLTKMRMSNVGQSFLMSSPIFQSRWVRMWSVARRMAVKFDRVRSGTEQSVRWNKEPSEGFHALNA